MRSLSASALLLSLVTLGASALAACGGGQPEPTAPAGTPSAMPSGAPSAAPAASATPPSASASASAAPAASASAAAPAQAPTWSKDMTKEQKSAFMKAHIVPRMSKVFKEADGKKYAEFGCKTCHGPQYKDPQEFLPKLTMKDGKLTAFAEKPVIAKYMAEKIVPEMASAMGMKPYDPATHQGFGCTGCHKVDMK
jgi:hypothetical protein